MTDADFLGADDAPQRDQSTSGTMIYTSGTTGNPKGAVRYEARSPDQGLAMLELMQYGPGDVYVTCGPLYHSGPGGFAATAHRLGNTIVVQHKFDAEDWLRLIDKYSCSSTFSAPTPIRMVVNLDAEVKAKYDTSSMRIMVANAAPWPFALKQAYVEDFPPESLWEIYGSTEMGVNCILAPEDQMRKPNSCGKPICDRKSDMIISGGMNIYPAELESALEQHPDIYEVAVIGVPSEDWGETVLAIVVTNQGSDLDRDGVDAFAREKLAGYKLPRLIEFVDEIPKTGSNKILKRDLRSQFAHLAS